LTSTDDLVRNPEISGVMKRGKSEEFGHSPSRRGKHRRWEYVVLETDIDRSKKIDWGKKERTQDRGSRGLRSYDPSR